MSKYITLLLLVVPFISFSQTKEDILKKIQAKPGDIGLIALIQQSGGVDPDYKELMGLFKKLSKKARKSTEGELFERYLKALESSSVGKKAPSITQFDLDGDPYALSDLRGKYVLIDFWASWSAVSKEFYPGLVSLYGEFKDKNFEILGISFDREYEPWKEAIEKNNLLWKHISDLQGWNSYASIVYGVKTIPQNILVDPKGIIIGRNLRGEDLRKKLLEVL